MSDRVKETGVTHTWLKTNEEDLVRQMDELGIGWPTKAKSLKFYHTIEKDDRPCSFFADAHNTGWWTVVLTPDQYYWIKLSDARKKEFEREIRDRIARSIRI